MITIAANNNYTLTEYALRRMLQRDIAESQIITTIDEGDLYAQDNGRDRYEKELWLDE
jgi:hypothetical protein